MLKRPNKLVSASNDETLKYLISNPVGVDCHDFRISRITYGTLNAEIHEPSDVFSSRTCTEWLHF